jgi:peptide-methionine (R)-S-oxide reductase
MIVPSTPSDEQHWKEKFSKEPYRVLRRSETEAPFSGAYVDHHEDGTYRCAACGALLFSSHAKFDSGTGWPSFTEPINRENVALKPDESLGMRRTEVRCRRCGGHLGHVFDDGPGPDGKRFCVNSVALSFQKK